MSIVVSQSHRLAGLGLALLAASAFGSSGAVARSLLDIGWTSSAVVLVRISLAALVLAIPAAVALRGQWRIVTATSRLLATFGVVCVAGAQLCFYNAVQHLSIGVALLLEYSGIVLVVGYVWLRTRVRPAPMTLLGTAVAVGGLALVLDVFGDFHLSGTGLLWGCGAAVGLATFYLIAARTDHTVPPLVMVTSGMAIGAVGLAIVGLIGLQPLVFAADATQIAGWPVPWWVPALWLGVVTAALAYLASVVASRKLGSTVASFVGLTEVLFAVVFAWWLVDEVPTGVQLVGGVLVVTGVALVQTGGRTA